jgi:hypothetical protein
LGGKIGFLGVKKRRRGWEEPLSLAVLYELDKKFTANYFG